MGVDPSPHPVLPSPPSAPLLPSGPHCPDAGQADGQPEKVVSLPAKSEGLGLLAPQVGSGPQKGAVRGVAGGGQTAACSCAPSCGCRVIALSRHPQATFLTGT